MKAQEVVSGQRGFSVKTLLPTVFSAMSVAITSWIAYQNTQLTPKVNELGNRVTQLQIQAEQTGGGVASLQQVDEARKRELFRRLVATGNDPRLVQQAFRDVFPEDTFWADETLIQTTLTAPGVVTPTPDLPAATPPAQ